jgi:hypothetical protein
VEGPFRDPDVPDGEETDYRGLLAGEEAGAGTMRVERLELDGHPFYRQLLSLRVQGEAEYEAEIVFRRRRGVVLADSYRAETSHEGQSVAVEEGRFRDVKGLQWGGEIEPFPADVSPLLGCALALRGLEFARGERRAFSLWLANTVHWPIETHVERTETISLPGGRRGAWRVRVRPSFERVAGPLDRLVAMILPPFVLHFDADPPHRFLRFEFPTGPFRWNPRGVIEATELR